MFQSTLSLYRKYFEKMKWFGVFPIELVPEFRMEKGETRISSTDISHARPITSRWYWNKLLVQDIFVLAYIAFLGVRSLQFRMICPMNTRIFFGFISWFFVGIKNIVMTAVLHLKRENIAAFLTSWNLTERDILAGMLL